MPTMLVVFIAFLLFGMAWLWPKTTNRFRGSVAGFDATLIANNSETGQLVLGSQKRRTIFSHRLMPNTDLVLLSVQPTAGVAWVGVLSDGRLHPFRLEGKV